ncbi:MAG: alpha/beta fold hydrolase [Flavobacteriales bacterium]|nr:alpha/beta fold hydrolase [Flavobacteriales bacterium]
MIRTITVVSIYCLFGIIISLNANGQELRRRGSLGVQFSFINDSIAKADGYTTTFGMRVKKVFEGTTTDLAGVKAGDILYQINELKLVSNASFHDPKFEIREGDPVSLMVERAGKTKKLTGKVVGRRLETSDQWDIIYGSVNFEGGKLRTIITKPKGDGKFPTILFIPGFTCMSIDNLNQLHPYRKIVDQLTSLGYAVYRVEKPGMGDCEGTQPCDQIDFKTEVAAFETGFTDMITKDFVDTSKTHIFGHSLGGIVAPFISSKHDLTGVIVYGTSHEPWHEYLMQMVRFQNPRFGDDYVKTESEMDLYWRLFDGLNRQNKSPLVLVAEDPEFGPLMKTALFWDGKDHLLGRHYRFNNSIDDLNATEAWANTSEHVLAMYAEADFEAIDPRATKNIVRIVNSYHPGKGTYQFVPETDHGMIKSGSMEETLKIRGTPAYRKLFATGFNTDIAIMIDKWIKEKTW